MLIIGIAGTTLAEQERAWLQHAAVSGVILFTRNFQSRAQVQALIADLRACAPRPILVCVDQEGGRVQRFREGFSALPALSLLSISGATAERLVQDHAWLMASEMRAIDIDLSFAPVLDLGRGNRAIGDRALHAEPSEVARLGCAYIRGMQEAGMAATLKHFPGHGSVLEDTHFDAAVDARDWAQIETEDLLPFVAGIAAQAEAVMMAHVSYPTVDADPAGYSAHWIRHILRQQLGFHGVVISDDIGMAAAESAGGVAARLRAHFDAGCDLVLVCAPALVEESLAAMADDCRVDADVVAALRGRPCLAWDELINNTRHAQALAQLQPLSATLGVSA